VKRFQLKLHLNVKNAFVSQKPTTGFGKVAGKGINNVMEE